MPKQTAISKVNEQYLKDRENGYTREYSNTENTARQMLEEYEREQEEQRRKAAEEQYQRQYSQYQSRQNAEIADWIKGMSPSALADDAQQRRLDTAQGIYTTEADTKHLGSGRTFGAEKTTAPKTASQKKRREDTAYQKYLAQYDGVSNQTLFTNADYMQNSARAAQMQRDQMASELAANPGLIFNQDFTQGMSAATAQADAEAQAASRLTNEYNKVTRLRNRQEERETYGSLNQNADYVKLSQGNAETAERANNSLSPKMIRYYNIYNREKVRNGATTGAPAEAYVTDDEAGKYFYLWEKQGAEAAEAYYNTYVKSRAQERRTNAERGNVQALAASSPVMGAAMSAASIPLQATGIIGMIDLTVQNTERRLGINTDKPINYNTAWQAPSGQASAIRESVANKIQTDVTKNLIESGHSEKNANLWGAAASFLYQTGMSMADSGVQALLVRVGLPQEAMLTLMAGGAGMNAIREAKQRGVSDGEALAYGYAAAFAEGIFEHVSLENLMNAKTPETIRQGVAEVLKQALAEGSEEFSTTYANTLTDMLINGGQSEISQKVLGYMADGLSNKEAYKAAAINWLKGAGMDFLGGALSGGAMGGMNVGVNLALNVKENYQAGLIQEDLRNIGRAQQAELAARQAYQAAQERTTPPLPKQEAQEQQERITTPPLPQSAQRAAETQQNNGLRIPAEDNARTVDVTAALRGVNPGIVEAMSEDTTIRDAVNAVNAEVQKGTISAEAGAEFLDMMWQAGSDNESRQGFLRSIYDTGTGELRPQALNAARRIDTRSAGQTLRLSDNAPAARQAPLTVGQTNDYVNANKQEVNNGQKQAEASAASEFRLRARENAAGRQALGGSEWTTGVARLLEAARNTRTNRNLQQRADAAARLQDQAEARRLVKQSGQDLGIEDASDAKTVTVLDNDMLGKEWEQMVSYYASKGVKLQAMIGQIETKDLRANGKPVTVRAWVSGDGKNIIVQADHPTLSWQQLLAHEELHRRIKENSAFKKAAQDALLADKSLKPYLSQIIDRYTEAYRAVKPSITDDEIIEELLADYRAGFDMLDPLGTLAGVRKATKAAARDIRALERKGVAQSENNAEEQSRGSASTEISDKDAGITLRTADGMTLDNNLGASDAEIEAEANEGKASREVDPDTLDMLNNQDLVTVYRAMQVVDGKLYPPMAAKVSEDGGKAQWVEPTEFDTWYRSDERPELIDAKGKFKLDKGNGKSLSAAYNPYFHTSNMMLNDQFSSAWDRDNLVVVEASIPKSELTSGYRAQGAKDPVGEMNWHSGPVASKLKGDKARRVTLSRWVKINRIVPNAEVAQSIAKLLNGENISVPENTVTPSLKAELEKLGVQISPATGNAAKGRDSTGKFSLNMPVEETADLIAVHNLTERNLIDMGVLGGAPAPSIAIVKAKAGHSKYGPISLVYGKDTIDPRKNSKNKVYGSDAWTPTAPKMGYQLDEKTAKAIRSRVEDILGDEAGVIRLHLDDDNLSDQLNRNYGSFADAYKNDTEMRYVFLKDTGRIKNAPTKEKTYSDSVSNKALRDLADRYDVRDLFSKSVDELMEYEPELRRWVKAAYIENQTAKGADPEKVQKIANALYEKPLTFAKMNDLLYAAMKMQYEGNVNTVDSSALYDMTKEAFKDKGIEVAYERWLDELSNGIIAKKGIRNQKELYTPSGNRRSFDALYDPYTLENIVKAMSKEQQRGAETFGITAGSLQSVTTPAYRNIAEIKADSGRLGAMDEEEYQKLKEDLDNRISDAVETVYKNTKHFNDNRFMEYDSIAEALINAARGDRSKDTIMWSMRRDGYEINDSIAEELESLYAEAALLPTEYFEAKPMRAVGFDEIVAAIVPDTISDNARKVLTDNGVNTIEYRSGDDNDRLAKLNSVESAKFSREIDAEYMAAAKSGDMETAQRMVDEAAKKAFSNSIITDKKGKLKTVWHGTTAKFNTFKRGDVGYHFGTKGTARTRTGRGKDARFIPAYLNITNPVEFDSDLGSWDADYRLTEELIEKGILSKDEARGVLLTDSGKYRRTTGEANTRLRNLLLEKGYDGITYPNTFESNGSTSYIAFEPSQIKSADPVTYDNDGNIIPLSERFNPADMDIRYSVEIDPDVAKQFSMEGIEERQVQSLLRENEELKKKLKDAKAQIKTSDRTQPREEDVRRMARDLLKAYSSKAEGVNESLRELAHTIMSNDARWTDVRDQAVRLAGTILENSSVLVGEDAALNRKIRNAIREEKIAYTNKGDIADYGQWRKDNFGKLKIAKDGIPVDTRWEELQDTYGKGYFPDDIKNPADQIVYLSELYDRLQDVYENPYNQNMAEATEFLANDIIDRVISGEMRQAPTTYADRAETRLARETLRGELREQKIKERLEAERERRKEKIAELKEHYKSKEAKGRENRKAKELRTKIINHAKQMTTELLKPTDKKHVPESLRKSVAAVLSAIDLGSGYDMTAGQDGKTLRVGRGTEGAEQTKRTKAFLELREALLKEADGLVLDPELLGTVEEPGNLTRLITELADVPIANMNTEQLQVVYDALRGIEGAVKSANRMLSQARWGAVSEAADAIRSENGSKIAPLQLAGPAGRVQDLTRLDMLTPEGYFHRLGKSGQAVFKLLRSAQDKFITNMTQATEATRKIVGDADVGALEKETHTVTMGGEQVTMTTAQIMELYCLMQRDQGLQHITTGGVLIEPVRKGIKQETQVEPLHPSMEELLNAVRLLTPDEVKMADALQKYLSEDLAELGNEATLNVYGYKKFGKEAKYWKIRSNKNEIQQSIEKETQTTSVANRGFTKAINPQANTSIKIGSIFDTYSQSVNDMATYAAWLDVGEDVNRIRNYVFRDSEGQRTGTVKGVLDRVIGTGGANYLQRLLADIANGAGMDDAGLTSGFVGAYKAAAIGANIRVIAQQPTAILRAAEMIDPKYLAVGLKNPMKAFERAKEYSPIAQWKDWGYFDINTGRKMKDVLFESSSKLEKVRQASMAMAGKADSFAWGQLWGAVEAETKDKTDLKPGTKEFYQACAERFNDIIDHTQVVDGILQRSQIMRSKNAITRMAVSFMSEPTKQYNQFMSAVYDYRHSGDKKQAKQMLARTTFSMLAAGILNVMAQALVDGLRDDDREKKYWEKVLQAFLGYNPDDNTFGEKFKTFAFSNMGEFINPASYLPYAKDIMSIIQGYSVDRMDMDAISDTITAMTRLYKAMNGEGKQSAGYSLVKAMEQGAKLLGLSVYNIDRDLTALFTTIANDADMPVLQYYLNRYRYKPTENLSKDLKGILWDARQKNDGSYDVIVNRLLKDGYTQEGIDKAMMNRLSDESGFTEARKAADEEGNNNGSYDLGETLAALDSIEVSEEDRDILLEAKLSEKQYSNYTTLLQYSDYDTWLSVMREMPANLSQAKIEAVLDKRDDLTTKQKAAYWQVLSGSTSAKNNPYSQEVGAEILDAKAENQPDKEPEKVAQMRTTLSGLGLQDSKVDALAPVLGGDGSNTSKWRAVANQNLGTDQQDAVLKSIMTDSMYRNWTIASGENISLDSYVKGREAYVDLDDSGTDQNSEWTAALEKVTFDKDATRNNYIKGVLWQIYTGSTSTKNNPFDKTGGQKVLDAKGKGGGKGTGSNAIARIPTLRIPAAPTVSKPSSGLRIRAMTPAAQAPRSGLRIKAQ